MNFWVAARATVSVVAVLQLYCLTKRAGWVKMERKSISAIDRITGCLLAGACGDALGAAVEFLSRDQILDLYGVGGICDFAPTYGRIGGFTDDTQMSLFTVEGLIRALQRGTTDGLEEVRTAYRQWLETQDEQFDVRTLAQRTGLIREKALWSRRAPGNTCLGALREMRNDFANNQSKGCGAVMRSAPFGFLVLAGQDLDQIFGLACGCARLTHGHRTGFLAAGAFSLIIAQLANGLPLVEAVSKSADLTAQHEGARETTTALRRALQIGRDPDWRGLIPTLGEGWVAEEALAIGVAAAVGASSLREAVIVAVNHDGDSDSTGSIAGNIRGVIEGPDAIPAEWLVPLEFRKGIVELGTQFAAELLATQSA